MSWFLLARFRILTWLYINRNRIFTFNGAIFTNILDRDVFPTDGIRLITSLNGNLTSFWIDRHYDVIRRIIRS